jgi:hypothetical protein
MTLTENEKLALIPLEPRRSGLAATLFLDTSRMHLQLECYRGLQIRPCAYLRGYKTDADGREIFFPITVEDSPSFFEGTVSLEGTPNQYLNIQCVFTFICKNRAELLQLANGDIDFVEFVTSTNFKKT